MPGKRQREKSQNSTHGDRKETILSPEFYTNAFRGLVRLKEEQENLAHTGPAMDTKQNLARRSSNPKKISTSKVQEYKPHLRLKMKRTTKNHTASHQHQVKSNSNLLLAEGSEQRETTSVVPTLV